MSIYHFEVNKINGEKISLEHIRGKLYSLSIQQVNADSLRNMVICKNYMNNIKNLGLIILGFPCNQFLGQEPGDHLEIDSYCKLNHGVTFPMFEKVHVFGKDAHPLFKYLTEHATGMMGSKTIKWNFTKFLIDQQGNVVNRYAPQTKPFDIEEDIKNLLLK